MNLYGTYEFNKNYYIISFSILNKLIRSQILIDDMLEGREQEVTEED